MASEQSAREEALQAQLAHLESQLAAAQRRSEAASASLSDQRGPRYRPKALEIFTGDSTELHMWLLKARQWLSCYPSATETEQAGMLSDHLGSVPLGCYMRLCEEKSPESVTASQVFDMLAAHFTDPLAAQTATLEFHSVQQGSMSVMELSNKLDELALTPGCDELRGPFVMRERFLSALNDDLAAAVASERLTFKTKAEAVLQATLQEQVLQRQYPPESLPSTEGDSAEEYEHEGEESGEPAEVAQTAALAAAQWRLAGRMLPATALKVAGTDGRMDEHTQCFRCGQWGHRRDRCPSSMRESN